MKILFLIGILSLPYLNQAPTIWKSGNLQDFIKQNQKITWQSFRHFAEQNFTDLLLHFKQIRPTYEPTEYQLLLPFHSNGVLKSEIDYHDLLSIDNINIKHITSFFNHGDRHYNDTSPFLLKSLNGPTTIPPNRRTNFTLIYGIGTSKPTEFLIREIKALSHPEVAFLLFYDNKHNRLNLYNLFESHKNIKEIENVYIIDSPRFSVGWGQITQALLQLVIAQAAVKFFPHSLYISFHSESDYPIAPNDIILDYLKKHYPTNYMEILLNPTIKEKRKDEFILFTHPKRKEIKRMIYYLFRTKVIPKAKWYNGANWFTMTMKDIKKMLDTAFKRFEIIDTLDYCLFADEMLFQTLTFEANISVINDYKRFIYWPSVSAHPADFEPKYFDKIVEGSKQCNFWSRKYKLPQSKKVLDMIDNYIKNFNTSEFQKICN